MSDFIFSANGTELSRTRNYIVLSRRRGTLLFAQLLMGRQHIDRLEARNEDLRGQLRDEANLLVHALHQLALAQEKEPQFFIRRWLRDHREVTADTNKEARLLT